MTDTLCPESVGSLVRIITFVAADSRYDDGKDEGLDETPPDIDHVDRLLDTVEIASGIDAKQQNACKIPSQDADEIKKSR